MRSLSRRRFLKISGGAVAALAAASQMKHVSKGAEYVLEKTGKSVKGIQKIPTYCDICFWKCGAIAYLKDGKLWKIEGNPEDPLSNGRLCPRGSAGIGAYFDTERLRAPLLRKGDRGNDRWMQVTWDEALDHIAEKMLKIKDKYGPESMALFSHGVGGTFLKQAFKAYGSPNLTAPSYAQCRGPRDVGFQLTYGDVVGSPERTDIENAKCLVLLGSHLGENMHNTQVQEFSRAIERDASIIVVDPRFSIAAGKAKYYLPIRPGTDTALLLSWMHTIVKEELYDKKYVAEYGFGFDEFALSIKKYTPEWAYPVTGIEPEIIRETAREMARMKPSTLIHPGRHVTWYGNDTQRSRAIALLNALLGSWGRKGGFYMQSNISLPQYPHPPYPKSEKGPVDNPGRRYPFAGSVLTNGIREATLTGEPYPIKGWMVYATNLLNALPNQQETIEAMQKLDLLVTIDVVGSEIAGWSDVVLPESTYLERYDDLNAPWYKEPFIALRQPVIDSPHDQKPNWWIARKLAKRLGVDDFFGWKDIEEYLDYRLKGAGYSLKEIKEKGIIKTQGEPKYYEEGAFPAFYTPSGKIEFFSPQLAEAGFDPVPVYEETEDIPPGYFRLLYGRSPVHSFGRTQTNPLMYERMKENEVWINNDVAKRLGLKSGSSIKLKNPDGIVSNSVKVKATERIRKDCMYIVHGFGHNSAFLKPKFKLGANDSELITNYKVDPLMGGTGMNTNFVTIEWEA